MITLPPVVYKVEAVGSVIENLGLCVSAGQYGSGKA